MHLLQKKISKYQSICRSCLTRRSNDQSCRQLISSTWLTFFVETVQRSPPVRWTLASVTPSNTTSRRATPSRSSNRHVDLHSQPETKRTSSSMRCWRRASSSRRIYRGVHLCAWRRRKRKTVYSASASTTGDSTQSRRKTLIPCRT